MNILIVGGGGREHAIARAIAKNPAVTQIYALPGNAGIAEIAACAPIASTDIEAIVRFAGEHAIDFAVVAQDDPLALGAVDRLHALGIPCFGPTQAAARIESSKVFSKALMRDFHIPTARYAAFDVLADAEAYVDTQPCPIVVKADGLALGKGVVIAQSRSEAKDALRRMMADGAFGESGRRVVIEECLEGPEVTVLSFTDGRIVVPMISSMDHKRALDGDMGANTGGMGVIAPNPFYTPEIARICMETIYEPTIRAMNSLGCPFKGCLYFGLMLTADGPKVIEYNCRFGDPEAQAVLPLLNADLLTIMQAVEAGRLNAEDVQFSSGASCCVMLASGGYPGGYQKGYPIDLGRSSARAMVYHSGTAVKDGALVTNGGRVLGVCATGATLQDAVRDAYAAVSEISFKDMFYRRDIGARALDA